MLQESKHTFTSRHCRLWEQRSFACWSQEGDGFKVGFASMGVGKVGGKGGGGMRAILTSKQWGSGGEVGERGERWRRGLI